MLFKYQSRGKMATSLKDSNDELTVKTGVLTEQEVDGVLYLQVCVTVPSYMLYVLVPVLLVFFNTSRRVVMWKKKASEEKLHACIHEIQTRAV